MVVTMNTMGIYRGCSLHPIWLLGQEISLEIFYLQIKDAIKFTSDSNLIGSVINSTIKDKIEQWK